MTFDKAVHDTYAVAVRGESQEHSHVKFLICYNNTMLMRNIFVLLSFLFGGVSALQCDVPGECFIMAIGGENPNGLNDVELVSLDPTLHPIPDCLAQLNILPEATKFAAGSLDYKYVVFAVIKVFFQMLGSINLLLHHFCLSILRM